MMHRVSAFQLDGGRADPLEEVSAPAVSTFREEGFVPLGEILEHVIEKLAEERSHSLSRTSPQHIRVGSPACIGRIGIG